jgi:hypothetical protein
MPFVPLVCTLALSVLVVSSTWAEEVANPAAPDAGRPGVLEATEAGIAKASPGRDPGQLPWAVLFGVYGDGGSNVLAVGVKYRF